MPVFPLCPVPTSQLLTTLKFVDLPLLDGNEQTQSIVKLMRLLQFGGFFHDQAGLNTLNSVKHIRKLLKMDRDFDVEVVQEKIEDFCRKRKISLDRN